MISKSSNNALKIINLSVLLQQQRYIVAISYLFYLQNGLTLSDFLLFQSIFYFTGLIAEIPAGYIADIFSRKKVLIFSYLLFMFRIILWIVAPNYWTILTGEILYGLSKAFYRGTSDSYIYDYLKSTDSTDYMLNKYGKFNFFMSCGSAISCLVGAWLYKYIGFSLLLGIELFCNSTAVFSLLFLPNLPQTQKSRSFKEHITTIFDVVKDTIKNSALRTYMLCGAVLSGITSVFVWNFQPMMKNFAVPVYMFGIIYFINHILRAVSSFNAHKFLKKIPLEQTGLLSWILYLISFVLMFNVMEAGNKATCIFVLLFVCVAIGVQMIFNVGNVARIHKLISLNTRATISSVNFMLTGLFSGLFLMVFKYVAQNNSIRTALLFFGFIFLFLILLIRKMYAKSVQS